MQAFVIDSYGSPLCEADLPEPRPARGQVAVRVTASGLNHLDERVRTGELKALLPVRTPKVMGSELSGTVAAVGAGVTSFAPGDPVHAYLGVTSAGSLARTVVVDAKHLAHAPRTVPLVHAAGLPVVALTAWQALVGIGDLRPGQRVLVHGGAGGVGSAAVQLAHHLGASVVTTVSARDTQRVRDLGADEVLDYRTQDLVEELADRPVDLVLSTQGDDVTLRSMQVVRRGGVVVAVSGTPEPSVVDTVSASALLKPALAWMSRRLRREARRRDLSYRFLFITPSGSQLERVAGLVDDGVLRPVVDRVLPFAQAPRALDELLAGGVRGKVLVSTEQTQG